MMKISTSITQQRSIKKLLQCSNKLYLDGVFKGKLKFIGLFQTHSLKPCTCTTQLASSIVFTCIFPKSSKTGNKSLQPIIDSYSLLQTIIVYRLSQPILIAKFRPSALCVKQCQCFCDKSQAIMVQFDSGMSTS